MFFSFEARETVLFFPFQFSLTQRKALPLRLAEVPASEEEAAGAKNSGKTEGLKNVWQLEVGQRPAGFWWCLICFERGFWWFLVVLVEIFNGFWWFLIVLMVVSIGLG